MKQTILHFFALFFLATGLSTQSAWGQAIEVDALPTAEVEYSTNTPPPTPLPIPSPHPPAWVHFWMFKDGSISRKPTTVRSNKLETAVQLRGTYTSDDEPPLMISTDESTGGSGGGSGSVDTFFTNNAKDGPLPRLLFFHNWRAAKDDDLVYFAAMVRNNPSTDNQQKGARSGYLRVWFPRDTFKWEGNIFNQHMPFLSYAPSMKTAATVNAVPGEVHTWRVRNLPPDRVQTAFFKVRVVGGRDSSTYGFAADLQWDSELPQEWGSQGNVFGLGPKGEGKTNAPNAAYFDEEATLALTVNTARDPNCLIVKPSALPPAAAAPAHPLTFRIYVENNGGAPANSLRLRAHFDPKVDMNNMDAVGNMYIGNQSPQPCNLQRSGNSIMVTVPKQLVPSMGGLDPNGSGYFEFTGHTKAGVSLTAGEQLVSRAAVVMLNASGSVADSVRTGPAYVKILHPGRLHYGTILSLKGSASIPKADSAGNRSLSLTLQIPLRNPVAQSLAQTSVPRPTWWWQIEAGVGSSQFSKLDDLYRTQLVHITPIQIRYTGFNVRNVNAGISAGYSADFLYKATRNGTAHALPTGFGKRIEHELALSADFFNLAGVPGIDMGAGYKLRQNRLTGSAVQYSMPFIYVRLNFALFQRRQMLWWHKIVRW